MLCCASVAIPATVLLCAGVVFTALALGWFSVIVSDVPKRREWFADPQKERAERVLAGAIAIDGRKDWICKFCSGSNVWTRRRCRRYVASTGRRSQQCVGKGQQAPRYRVGTRKTLRLRSVGPKLSIIGSRVEEKSKEGQAFHREEKVAWRKYGN